MTRQKREFKTLEEFREYQRQVSKKWYQDNREKKLEYQRNRYYSTKLKKQEEALESNQ